MSWITRREAKSSDGCGRRRRSTQQRSRRRVTSSRGFWTGPRAVSQRSSSTSPSPICPGAASVCTKLREGSARKVVAGGGPTPPRLSNIVSCYGSAPRTQWFRAGQGHMVAFQQCRFHICVSQRKLDILDPFKPCPGTAGGINFANLRRLVSCRNYWSARSPRSPLCKVESCQHFVRWPAQGEV